MVATTIEQSKRLLELGLPKETADMTWKNWSGDDKLSIGLDPAITNELYSFRKGLTIPAWSLSALLDVIPKPSTGFIDLRFLYHTTDGRGNHLEKVWCISYDDIENVSRCFYASDKVDAVFGLVCWLLEVNLIEKVKK